METYDENLILGYIEQELTPAQQQTFEAQLRQDVRLRALVTQLIHDRHLLQSLPSESPPASLREAVQNHLERQILLGDQAAPPAGEPQRPRSAPQSLHLHAHRARVRWWSYAGMAAGVALVASVLFVMLGDNGLSRRARELDRQLALGTTAPDAKDAALLGQDETLSRSEADLTVNGPDAPALPRTPPPAVLALRETEDQRRPVASAPAPSPARGDKDALLTQPVTELVEQASDDQALSAALPRIAAQKREEPAAALAQEQPATPTDSTLALGDRTTTADRPRALPLVAALAEATPAEPAPTQGPAEPASAPAVVALHGSADAQELAPAAVNTVLHDTPRADEEVAKSAVASAAPAPPPQVADNKMATVDQPATASPAAAKAVAPAPEPARELARTHSLSKTAPSARFAAPSSAPPATPARARAQPNEAGLGAAMAAGTTAGAAPAAAPVSPAAPGQLGPTTPLEFVISVSARDADASYRELVYWSASNRIAVMTRLPPQPEAAPADGAATAAAPTAAPRPAQVRQVDLTMQSSQVPLLLNHLARQEGQVIKLESQPPQQLTPPLGGPQSTGQRLLQQMEASLLRNEVPVTPQMPVLPPDQLVQVPVRIETRAAPSNPR